MRWMVIIIGGNHKRLSLFFFISDGLDAKGHFLRKSFNTINAKRFRGSLNQFEALFRVRPISGMHTYVPIYICTVELSFTNDFDDLKDC